MGEKIKQRTERLTMAAKNAKDFQWYKDNADRADVDFGTAAVNSEGVSDYQRMKVNYDLFNNKLNLRDFEYVCQPFGSEAGELPAKMVNRDISSGKIKAMLGMEIKRPFSWNVIATNPEATTRKEQEEFGRIKEWVVGQIINPLRIEIENKKAEENKGKPLTPEEQQRIQEEINQELEAQTPEETRKYMQRKHQDPAEVMSQQLLEYLMAKTDVKRKFNNTFKHGLISARGLMYVGIMNGEPEVWNVNSLRFKYAKSPDLEFVQDAERASCEFRMSVSDVVRFFGSELSEKDIDKLYNGYDANEGMESRISNWLADDSEDSGSTFNFDEDFSNSIRVVHHVWKSLRQIGFLTYEDEEGEMQEMIVDENYKLNKDHGDIRVEWEWLPEVYETWKIQNDIYVRKQPIPGQFKDLDNLYHCPLPYYGAIYDNMNSEETSLMDRLKPYQYYYNIVSYRLELLLASDKGKKVLMNINAIPDSAGIDIKKWQYFMESTPYMWYDPNEEGSGYQDVNTVAKVIDLSLASDIQKYIEIAEYLRLQQGKSVGITDNVEGQAGSNESVTNNKQNLVQSSHILEWYFDLHSYVKRDVLQALLETAKIAYRGSGKKKLSYFLDDMSQRVIEVDMGLLDNSTLGLFVTNSSKSEEAKAEVKALAHAAMQNGTVGFSDVVSTIRLESIVEIEETIAVAEEAKIKRDQAAQQEQIKAQADESEKAREFVREAHGMEKEIVVLKEEEKRKTVVVQSSLMGMSFNPEADSDGDGINDFLEVAKHGLNADVQRRKVALEENKFEEAKKVNAQKLKNEAEKIKISKSKQSASKK